MTEKQINKLYSDAEVTEVTENELVMTQKKDKQGVCIIPEKQDKAARALLTEMGRTVSEVCGSKRGTLRYSFTPSLTEEEYEKWGCE